MGDLLIGPDGFAISQSDPRHAEQILLNTFLAETANDLERFVPDAKWKKLAKRQTIDLITAILHRLKWLYDNDDQLRTAHVDRIRLIKLLRTLYRRKLPCTESDLRMIVDSTVPLLEAIAPDGPIDYVMDYYQENDLTPALCDSLRQFSAHLVEQGSVASMQSLRQRLYMLLWMDEWEPLDPARCWSEGIRRDFRAMTNDRKYVWRKLLKHIRGNAPVNMPAGWAKDAAELIAAVGVDDFVEQLSLWFAPFRSGQPLPLSVAGSHVLKGLIWFASVSQDERAKEVALSLLDVKWKQKKNISKSMIALGVFGISKEELLARKLIKELAPAPNRIIQRVLEVMSYPQMNTNIVTDPDEDLTIVQGQLHFYRIFRQSGRIERVTDNVVLELNWPAIPDQLRLHLTRECDTGEQLQLRAVMLMYDSINADYFTVSSKRRT